jgi:hypothetical protein
MLRSLVTLALLGLLVHAVWRVTPVYWRYLKLRDGVREVAQFSAGLSEDELRDRVTTLARMLEVPVAREDVSVRREADRTFVDLRYSEPLYLLPRKPYPWTFAVSVSVWHVRPPTLGDIVPKGSP